MSHDVYICYDKRESEISDALYGIFKENNIEAWIKSRHFAQEDTVDKITTAISDAKCFILILSKHSKDTNYVVTEADIAFSREIPIIVYNIDDSILKGNMEFILETQRKIASFPNTKKQLETLVQETAKIINKPIGKARLDSKYVKVIDKYNPNRKENLIKKAIAIAIPIAIALILIYLFVIVPTGQNTTEDGIFTMNVTNVEINPSGGAYLYTVYGESYNLPSDSERYFMNIKFLDDNDEMVYEVNSTADEFKSGILWSGEINTNNVTHIDFKLTDMEDNILSKQKYLIDD